jgi:hypothetical protein
MGQIQYIGASTNYGELPFIASYRILLKIIRLSFWQMSYGEFIKFMEKSFDHNV